MLSNNILDIIKIFFMDYSFINVADVYVVGSLVDGELYTSNDSTSMSDIDLIIDLHVVDYFKFFIYNRLDILQKGLSNMLKIYGYNVDISISFTCSKLYSFFPSLIPNSLYQFEMISLLKCDKKNINNKIYCRDALTLLSSSLIDFFRIYINNGKELKSDDVYILIKRCLTSLYILMIFRGVFIKGYMNRINHVICNKDFFRDQLTTDDINILYDFTKYKLGYYSRTYFNEILLRDYRFNDYNEIIDYYINLSHLIMVFGLNKLYGDNLLYDDIMLINKYYYCNYLNNIRLIQKCINVLIKYIICKDLFYMDQLKYLLRYNRSIDVIMSYNLFILLNEIKKGKNIDNINRIKYMYDNWKKL